MPRRISIHCTSQHSYGRSYEADLETVQICFQRLVTLILKHSETGLFSQTYTVILQCYAQLQVFVTCAGLSCYLPLRHEPTVLLDGAKATPVFLGHGSSDPLVPIELGEMTKGILEEKGVDVDFRKYPMAHSACPEELQDMSAFLDRVLP